MNVGGLRLHGCNLTLSFGALLEFGHLLTLNGRCSNLLSENDVSNLAGSKGCDINAIPFPEVLTELSIRI